MKRKILISLVCLITFLIIGQVSYASVEIVPSKNGTGKDAMVNTTVSNSYLLCRQMKEKGGSLYGTTVEPHLATNTDWGAIAYLSNSVYGTNTAGAAKGVEVTIDGVKYYSTTTNITGIMNWGSNPNATRYTQTAGLISAYVNSVTEPMTNVTELYNNVNTRFVDLIGTDLLGMAISETQGLYGSTYVASTSTVTYPVPIRSSLFGVAYGFATGVCHNSGGRANSEVTFRPVIWNQ